ncbi:hypothetical protein F5Y14DRAFT_450866 [Nemania sp. NC0429]|nr:hypothetical protein F5Y14DRAFT_450866 [Nemania sp. NC0429]
MQFEAHPPLFEPFRAYAGHMRRPQDVEIDSRRHPQPAVSAISPSPFRYTLTGDVSKYADGSSKTPWDGSRPATETRSASKSLLSIPKSHNSEARHEHHVAKGGIAGEHLEAEEEKRNITPAAPTVLALRPNTKKRVRPEDDVDGPGTAKLPVKKRRLLLRLVTSRLSRPFSLPATHILIRESNDNMPVLHRIQQLATTLGARRAGRESALVRKAAILNRVRIGVRQAAMSRGHVIMADLAARGNTLDHGLLFVTAAASGDMGAMYPVAGGGQGPVALRGSGPAHGPGIVPPVWRPHTTSFHPLVAHDHQRQQHPMHGVMDATNRSEMRQAIANQARNHLHGSAAPPAAPTNSHPQKEAHAEPGRCTTPSSALRYIASTPTIAIPPPDASDEEDNTAFPASSFCDRYADLSDDDMDDVYADFGVLFGSGACSPEARAGGSPPVEEQFYEEYLDELDGIPWVV